MIVTAVSWIWIGISALLWGFAALSLLKKIEQSKYLSIYLVLVLGLAALTVYSEVYSLFAGVNLMANAVVLVADIIIAVIMRRAVILQIKEWIKDAGLARIIAISLIGMLVCLLSAMVVTNGDSYLYHQQAIHWIYEYGVVKGLGNLHTRFAFNSAFLCLQTLFSVPFAVNGMSLHSLNGFIVWIFLSYTVCSMKVFRNTKLYVSDFTRLGMLIYLATEYAAFSSPGTDIFALGLASFIICEWVSLTEEKCADSFPYALLCILIAFDITLKLSTAMLIILLCRPAYLLIKRKKKAEIIAYLMVGIIVSFPFFARNYGISGWLVYPFDKIDIFNVDWKIPKKTLSTECIRTLLGSRQIYLKGLGTKATFSEWFPYWRTAVGNAGLTICLAAMVSACVSVPLAINKIIKYRDLSFSHIVLTLVVSIIYWYISAPMIRYGRPFLIILPCFVMGTVIVDILNKKSDSMGQKVYQCILLALILCCFIPMIKYARYERRILNLPYDYYLCSVTEHDFYGEKIYVPDTFGRMSYYTFPCIQYESCLDIIELRGDDYSDGFRALPGVDDII